MGKFLLLPVLLLFLIFIGITMVFRFVRRIFRPMEQFSTNSAKRTKKENNEEVLYRKDNVVVLKGEAANKASREN